jgi:hypothetical protein
MFQGRNSAMRMIGDAGQHVAEIGFGIDSVQFGGADQACV